MKKFTFLVLALVCSMSAFSTRYLVELGTPGAATWTVTTGGTVVNLGTEGKTLNAWLTDVNATLGSNEVWVAAGTYVFDGNYAVANGFTIYGGFAGTETTLAERVKGTNPWDFVNETILDGNNAVRIFFLAGVRRSVFDGLTLTNGVSTENNHGGALSLRANATQRSIARYCKFINNSGTQGGAVAIYSNGEVSDCYFYGNSAAIPETTTGLGGAIVITSTGLSENLPAKISNCLFDSNEVVGQGGAIRSQSPGTIIENCIFLNNSATAHGGAIYTQSGATDANKIINCLVSGSKGQPAVYVRGASLYNCTLVDNVAGALRFNTEFGAVYNSVIWGETNAKASVAVDANATTTIFENNAYVVFPTNAWTAADNIQLSISSADANYPHFADDWSLTYQSVSLLNAADVATATLTDIAGITRTQGGSADIGAYELPYYTITVNEGENGTVTGGYAATEPQGKPIEYTITPAAGYVIGQVVYNASNVTEDVVEGIYTALLLEDATLNVTFAEKTGTGLNTLENAFTYFVQNNTLNLNGVLAGQILTIYNVTGAKVLEQVISGNSHTVELNKGLYVVRLANSTAKVVIK